MIPVYRQGYVGYSWISGPQSLGAGGMPRLCVFGIGVSVFSNSFVLKLTEPIVRNGYVTSYKHFLRAALGEAL